MFKYERCRMYLLNATLTIKWENESQPRHLQYECILDSFKEKNTTNLHLIEQGSASIKESDGFIPLHNAISLRT